MSIRTAGPWEALRTLKPSCLALLPSAGVTVKVICLQIELQLSSLLVLFKDPSSADFDLL